MKLANAIGRTRDIEAFRRCRVLSTRGVWRWRMLGASLLLDFPVQMVIHQLLQTVPVWQAGLVRVEKRGVDNDRMDNSNCVEVVLQAVSDEWCCGRNQ